MILLGRTHSIRNTINDGGDEAKVFVLKDLMLRMLPIANTYTGANFSTPPTDEEKLTLKACAGFIMDMFPMIGLAEIQLAFSMAAAGKFPKLNLETYYGKFSVQFLGKVLRAYVEKRKGVIAKYEQQLSLEESKKDETVIQEKNKSAKQCVIDDYNAIRETFEQNGDMAILEAGVYPYWGKILVEAEIINFTLEEKREIVKEAKVLTEIDIKRELQEEVRPATRRGLQTILTSIAEGNEDASFELKWRNKYAKLIVIKSILNG